MVTISAGGKIMDANKATETATVAYRAKQSSAVIFATISPNQKRPALVISVFHGLRD
ncbi:MAG: hypothetical protein IPH55_06685 [Betaproteobacteria bacterium]|nr:hypothetical protein [Betaproteobacteria bacterium]